MPGPRTLHFHSALILMWPIYDLQFSDAGARLILVCKILPRGNMAWTRLLFYHFCVEIILTLGDPHPQGMFGQVWRHFWLPHRRMEVGCRWSFCRQRTVFHDKGLFGPKYQQCPGWDTTRALLAPSTWFVGSGLQGHSWECEETSRSISNAPIGDGQFTSLSQVVLIT